jgi:hypothetical protein
MGPYLLSILNYFGLYISCAKSMCFLHGEILLLGFHKYCIKCMSFHRGPLNDLYGMSVGNFILYAVMFVTSISIWHVKETDSVFADHTLYGTAISLLYFFCFKKKIYSVTVWFTYMLLHFITIIHLDYVQELVGV